MEDPDATRVRPAAAAGPDPDATLHRPAADPDGTLRRPTVDPDVTLRRPPAPARDPTTVVRVRRPPVATPVRGDAAVGADGGDPDATVVRVPVLEAFDEQGDDDRTLQRRLVDRPLPPARALALEPGTLLHEYRIDQVLGQGGFGITYLATDTHLHAQVAIKEYLPESIAFRASDRSVAPNASQHRERYAQGLVNFLTEARTLATFRHPNIVRVARFFEAHRTAYMVLEYERGSSLRSWWTARMAQGFEPGRAEQLLCEALLPLLDGLAVVHAAGYLHRDIKPDNIQVRDDDGRLVLLDFGSAGQAVALADDDAVVVTPGYAPLEQYGIGEQGPWTDVYALGATLYWAVTGTKPLDAEARARGVPLKPAAQAGAGRFGAAFLDAIDWALQRDVAARPASLDEWRVRLLADHVGSLNLQDALARGNAADGGTGPLGLAPARGGWLRLQRLRRVSDWPLAARLAAVLAATALLPMLLTGLYNLHGAQAALQDAQLGKAELIAHNTAGRIGQLVASGTQLARGLGGDAEVPRWLSAPNEMGLELLQQRLGAMARTHPDVQFVMVMDNMGGVRMSTDPSLLGRNFGFRDYWKAAMSGRTAVSGIVVGAEAAEPGVVFAEPVRDEGGQVSGAVVVRVKAQAVQAILAEVQHDSQLTPFLLDGDGVLVIQPRPDRLYRSLVPLPEAAQQRIASDQRFKRDRIESLGETELAQALAAGAAGGHLAWRSVVDQSEQIAGHARVPGHDWTVVVSESRDQFERPLVSLRWQLWLSVLLLGLLFVGLGLKLARGLVRPLRALTDGVDALRAGRFDDAQVAVRSRDELGQLARTFNVMVDVLRQRERERTR